MNNCKSSFKYGFGPEYAVGINMTDEMTLNIIKNTLIQYNERGDIKLIDLLSEDTIQYRLAHGVSWAAYSSRKDRVLFTNDDGELLLLIFQESVAFRAQLDAGVETIGFINASNEIYVSTSDNFVRIFSADLKDVVLEIRHSAEAFWPYVSDDGAFLLCQADNQSVQLWDVGSQKLIFDKAFPNEVIDRRFVSEDGLWICVETNVFGFRVYRTKTQKLVYHDNGSAEIIKFPSG